MRHEILSKEISYTRNLLYNVRAAGVKAALDMCYHRDKIETFLKQ